MTKRKNLSYAELAEHVGAAWQNLPMNRYRRVRDAVSKGAAIDQGDRPFMVKLLDRLIEEEYVLLQSPNWNQIIARVAADVVKSARVTRIEAIKAVGHGQSSVQAQLRAMSRQTALASPRSKKKRK